MFCHECGAENPDGALFCSECGTGLGDVAEATEAEKDVAVGAIDANATSVNDDGADGPGEETPFSPEPEAAGAGDLADADASEEAQAAPPAEGDFGVAVPEAAGEVASEEPGMVSPAEGELDTVEPQPDDEVTANEASSSETLVGETSSAETSVEDVSAGEAPVAGAHVGEAPHAPRSKKSVAFASVALVVALAAAFCGAGVAGLLPRPFSDWFGTTGIVLDEVENEKLRSYLSEHFDEDGNGAISKAEAEKVTNFGDADDSGNVTDDGISSLDIDDYGFISDFPNVEVIVCQDNPATELDVSGCSNLKKLVCSGGGLQKLKASGCKNLTYVLCKGGQVTDLDVSGSAGLKAMDCSENAITSLNVSGTDSLEGLDCSDNQLASLDTTGAAALTELDCSGNQLSELKPSPALVSLTASNNPLTSVDFSACESLENVVLDSGVEFGTTTDVDDATREALSAMALEYVYASDDGGFSTGVSATSPLTTDNANFNVRLVHVALSPDDYGLGWYDADEQYVGRLDGAGSMLGLSGNSISTEDLQKVFYSFYGQSVSVPELVSASNSLYSLSYDSSGDEWSWAPVTASVSTNVYTNNFRASGKLLRFDVGYQQQSNNYSDDVDGSFYTVTAIKDEDSIFGYRLVRIEEMTGDTASEFPAMAALMVATAVPTDLVGNWYIQDWRLHYTINADGTCSARFDKGDGTSSSSTGTWERDENYKDTINCLFYGDDGINFTLHMDGETSSDKVPTTGRMTSPELANGMGMGNMTAVRE